MMLGQASQAGTATGIAETLDRLVAVEGTGAHAYVRSGKLDSGALALRNLADAVHFLCFLHGRQPGVIDHAARRTADRAARGWLDEASAAFTREREYLSLLVARVGPMPSTIGQAQCEAAVKNQRHALDMLAQSDRRGCALGAALALALDWRMVRALLDTAAHRLDITPTPCLLPDLPGTVAVIDAISDGPAVDRALCFGAQQLLGQHRGLWDLIAAREAARD